MSRFSVLVFAALLSFSPAARADAPPPGTAILELAVPAGAAVALDGRDVGERRTFTFPGFAPGQMAEYAVRVTLPGLPAPIERKVLLRGGWRVPLAIPDPRDARPELVPQTGHPRFVKAFALSPDGRRVATCDEKYVIVWDLTTGHQIRRFAATTNNGFIALAFSPDGTRLAAAETFYRVAVWDLASDESGREWRSETGAFLGGVRFTAADRLLIWGREAEPFVEWSFAAGNSGITTPRLVDRPKNQNVESVSADGRFVLLRSSLALASAVERRPTLWDAATGKLVNRFDDQIVPGSWVAYAVSPDGSRVAAGANIKPGGAFVWDAATGERPIPLDTGGPTDGFAFTPDGEKLVTSGPGGLDVWNARTGVRLLAHKVDGGLELQSSIMKLGERNPSLAITADGGSAVGYRVVVTPHGNVQELVVVDLKTAARRVVTVGRDVFAPIIAFSPDGKRLVASTGGSHQASLSLWDLTNGRRVWENVQSRILKVDPNFHQYDRIHGMGLTPSGSAFALIQVRYTDSTQGKRRRALLIDLLDGASGEGMSNLPPFRLTDEKTGIEAVLSRDGGRALVWGSSGTEVWATYPRKKLQTLDAVVPLGSNAVISDDGSRVLTGSDEGLVNVWDAATGKRVRTLTHNLKGWHNPLHVRADGRYAVTAGAVLRSVYDLDSGAEVLWAQAEPDWQWARPKGFTPDGLLILVRDNPYVKPADGAAALYDMQTNRVRHVIAAKFAWPDEAVVSPNGRIVAVPAEGGAIRLGDMATGEVLADLVSFGNGDDWLAVSPLGYFDGSAGGRNRVLFRTAGMTAAPVDRFFKDYYRSGFLAAALVGESFGLPPAMTRKTPPALRILSPRAGDTLERAEVTVAVEATDRGGGVPTLALFHNGGRVPPAGPATRTGLVVRQSFTFKLVSGKNDLELRAPAGDGDAVYDAEPVAISLPYRKPTRPPALLMLAVGVSQYQKASYNLKYAASDATAMADAFRSLARPPLYRGEPIIERLTDKEATRAGIRAALGRLKGKAESSDTLLVFLAGHGRDMGQRFYFLTHEFDPPDGLSTHDAVSQHALASDVLSEWVCEVPASKRVMIYDACHSGAAVGVGARTALNLGGAVEELSRATGIHTLAAAAAGTEAMEPDSLGHGVLTYALLAGLGRVDKGQLRGRRVVPLGETAVVSVEDWFKFADRGVREVSKHECNREQDTVRRSQRDFPLVLLEK